MTEQNDQGWTVGSGACEPSDTNPQAADVQRRAYRVMSGFDRVRIASAMFSTGWRLLDFRYVDAREKVLHLHAATLSQQQKVQLQVLFASRVASDA